jgi:hypothetical protein
VPLPGKQVRDYRILPRTSNDYRPARPGVAARELNMAIFRMCLSNVAQTHTIFHRRIVVARFSISGRPPLREPTCEANNVEGSKPWQVQTPDGSWSFDDLGTSCAPQAWAGFAISYVKVQF